LRLLLDACTFLWLAVGDPALSPAARAVIAAPENDLFLSSVSAAEIAVKVSRGRLRLAEVPDRLVPAARRRHRIAKLPLTESAALKLAGLPNLHRDPIDRLLVAQALTLRLVLLTPDVLIRRYPVPTLW
jgi:PIN domain nuclease of toxin-antitoxin system